MDPTTQILLGMAQTLHISPVAAAFWIPMIIIFSNRAAKLIPDNATGWLAAVRVVCVVLGLKVSNNTGVTPVQDSQGKIIQRSDPTQGEQVADEVLELTDVATAGSPAQAEQAAAPAIQQVFQLGAAALEKAATHEG